MAKTRSELRSICMVILYQYDLLKESMDIEEIIANNLEIDNDFVRNIVYGVIKYLEDIDKLANKYMKDWTIDRIEKLGCAILRMAIYEIKYTDTPEIVVINEALELAKVYCDESVKKIINAVLDKIIKEEK